MRQDVLLERYSYPPGPPIAIPRHTHEQYQLNLNLGVPGGLHYRRAFHVVPAGRLTVVMPGEAHTPVDPDHRDRDSEHLTLYVDAGALGAAADEIAGRSTALPFFRDLTIDDDATVARFARTHAALSSAPATVSVLDQDVRLLGFVSRLLRRHAGVAGDRPLPPAHRSVRRARAYLHEHRAGAVSLADLARVSELSPYHLTRLFTADVGLPPHAYQLQLRVDHAKRLLLAGRPVSDAGHEAGFFDLSHFTRHFKRHVGVPPGRYAREVRKDVHSRAAGAP
nr:AraC family transcriptional regulator [Jiangella mangrovi]